MLGILKLCPLSAFAIATLITTSASAQSALPAPWQKPVGSCFVATVQNVESRLIGAPASGSAITYTNGAYQVSYDRVAAIEHSRTGDRVKLCVVHHDRSCDASEHRGNTYKAINLRSKGSWTLPDSTHQCAGA